MKQEGLVEKVMHFLVHNSFFFTVVVMCLVHVALLGLSIWAYVMPLVYFNIVSVIVYLFSILLCRVGQIMPVYYSILIEVSVYAYFAVHNIGWRSGSFYYIFSIVPIIIYFGTHLFKGKRRWYVVAALVLNFALYTILYLLYNEKEPVYQIDPLIRSVMVIFSSFVMFFSVVFYSWIYIYLSQYEMNNLEKKNVQLTLDATEDALTGLLNRRGFMPILEQVVKNERTNHFCIAFCDIDNFKRINDSYGHDCGDEVLRHIAGIIKKEMYGCEICRWGGEEIVVLLRDYDFAVAKEKMEYIRTLVESTPTVFYNKRIFVTITIGLEKNEGVIRDPDDIIKTADARMYYGKQHGKNILVYDDKQI